MSTISPADAPTRTRRTARVLLSGGDGRVLLFRYVLAERMGTIILSAFVAHTGWHWMIERGTILSKFRFQWPEFNAAFLASLLRWMMAAVILAGILWLFSTILRSQSGRRREEEQA